MGKQYCSVNKSCCLGKAEEAGEAEEKGKKLGLSEQYWTGKKQTANSQ
ncbi:MAG: hypothetical protein QNJ54_15810 [Prochloraceae cyanobacterium]|nr:hypothetical protein [Prochloraceae cyanobacterium]